MSVTDTRIPLATADKLAAWLMSRWAMDPGPCAVVGSVRRRSPDIGDLDFIAPMPAKDGRDWLCMAISADMDGDGLFAGGPKKLGYEVSGLRGWFKCTSVVIRGQSGEVKVQIHRYAPAPAGNRGWVEIIRTGPAEFGEEMLSTWKWVQGIGKEDKGSVDGFLVDQEGTRIWQDTELSVFNACKVLYLDPDGRRPELVLRVDQMHTERGHEIRKRLGMSVDQVERAWRDQVRAAPGAGG